MQEELEIMRPMLEEAAKDTLLTMDQIKVGCSRELLSPAPSLVLCEDAQHLKHQRASPWLSHLTGFSFTWQILRQDYPHVRPGTPLAGLL